MANKIKYGLRNVYYAPITTVSTAGVPTYGTPVRILGGVNLSMTPAGESTDFYADDVVFGIPMLTTVTLAHWKSL